MSNTMDYNETNYAPNRASIPESDAPYKMPTSNDPGVGRPYQPQTPASPGTSGPGTGYPYGNIGQMPGAPVQNDPATNAQSALSQYALTPYNYDLNSQNPENSLDYQSFLRGMGLEGSEAQAGAAMNQAQIEAGLQLSLPEIQREEGLGLTSANNQAALAGSANSSARLTADTNVQNAANYQSASAQQQVAQQIAQSQFGLNTTMAGLQTQKSEQALAAQQALLGVQNQNAAYQNAMLQYGIGTGVPASNYNPSQAPVVAGK